MSDLSEVTEAVKSMGVSWETFKKSNGERLDAIELASEPGELVHQRL